MSKKFKRHGIAFIHMGQAHSFVFTPEEEDWWTSFKSKDHEFDVHYCEEYNSICVYEVFRGVADTSKTIYKQEIRRSDEHTGSNGVPS